MKQSHLLILLLALATCVGLFLYQGSHEPVEVDQSSQSLLKKETITSFLERETGLSFLKAPETKVVSGAELIEITKASLVRRYGSDGLKYRNRVFELLGLIPPGHLLAEELLIAETAAKPGWFDPTSGTIYLHEQFKGIDPFEQATLLHLKARALLHQHDPLPEQPLSDDARNMREALHGGIASHLEATFRSGNPENSTLPSSAEMEREGALLSLPIYLHNLIQLPVMQGKDYVQKQLAEGRTIRFILDEAPDNTLALFTEETADSRFTPPDIPNLILHESLGAYATQLIGERLADYVTAETLAESWRGDHYSYSKNKNDETLYWVSRWSSHKDAKKLSTLLQQNLGSSIQDPTSKIRDQTHISQRDDLVIFIHTNNNQTLQQLLSK